MKGIFDITFMRGEIEINENDHEILIPSISKKEVNVDGRTMTVVGDVLFLFVRTKEKYEGKPIFELKKITQGKTSIKMG